MLETIRSAFLLCFIQSVGLAAPTELWVYKSANLLVPESTAEVVALIQRAGKAGYTHLLLTDSKFNRLAEMPPRYFENVRKVQTAASVASVEIVPALFSVGYSADLLSRDPNLVEAMPVRDQPLIVRKGQAELESPQGALLPGSAFQDRKKWSFVDETVVFQDGTARVTHPETRARFARKVAVAPFREYRVRVSIATTDFAVEPEIKALPASGQPSLLWTRLHVKPTQKMTEYAVVFNSLENTEVTLYFGTWYVGKGMIEWRNPVLEEVAFLNLVRREGCPLAIRTVEGKALDEGKDFQALRDPALGNVPYAGSFDERHEPPRLRTALPDGTRLLANYYHAAMVNGEQVMICPSEPKTLELLRDQAQRVHALWRATTYMMSHDEIRILNHCAACQRRGITPGQMIAENARECVKILKEVNPAGRIFVWSDMFDPNHNAKSGGYYLVNGSLTGSWEGLEPGIGVVPWYYEKRAESLRFFADRGHPQIIGGYYDSMPERIQDWIEAAKPLKNVKGVMYTTWRNRYDQLEKFAEITRAAWGPR